MKNQVRVKMHVWAPALPTGSAAFILFSTHLSSLPGGFSQTNQAH